MTRPEKKLDMVSILRLLSQNITSFEKQYGCIIERHMQTKPGPRQGAFDCTIRIDEGTYNITFEPTAKHGK